MSRGGTGVPAPPPSTPLIHPTGLISKEQTMQTYICAHCAKNVIYTVHEFGRIVKIRNIKKVKTKKKLLGTIFNLDSGLSSKAKTLLCICKLDGNNII